MNHEAPMSRPPGRNGYDSPSSTTQATTPPPVYTAILWQNADRTVTLLDIPRSLEVAQGLPPDERRRIRSCPPLQEPYATPEPKTRAAVAAMGEVELSDLILKRHLEFALAEARDALPTSGGVWCLDRIDEQYADPVRAPTPPFSTPRSGRLANRDRVINCNPWPEDPMIHNVGFGSRSQTVMFPPKSQCVQEAFPLASEYIIKSANKYGDVLPEGATDDLERRRVHVWCPFVTVVMDPPWPNRSARRAGDYKTSYGTKEIKELLGMVPVRETLWEAGYVAVWVTNKAAFREMLLEEGGFFEQWGAQLVEEWTWLKVTAKGEPICKLDSRWRKPYEVLLIGRKTEGVSAAQKAEGVKRRTIVAVPDLHSRKPNLKELLGQLEGVQEGYKGLEVFARNLTSGWDAVGDEACKFQQVHHWIEESTDSHAVHGNV